jgi:hypothetical protein
MSEATSNNFGRLLERKNAVCQKDFKNIRGENNQERLTCSKLKAEFFFKKIGVTKDAIE